MFGPRRLRLRIGPKLQTGVVLGVELAEALLDVAPGLKVELLLDALKQRDLRFVVG
jgi:hypothetical protein